MNALRLATPNPRRTVGGVLVRRPQGWDRSCRRTCASLRAGSGVGPPRIGPLGGRLPTQPSAADHGGQGIQHHPGSRASDVCPQPSRTGVSIRRPPGPDAPPSATQPDQPQALPRQQAHRARASRCRARNPSRRRRCRRTGRRPWRPAGPAPERSRRSSRWSPAAGLVVRLTFLVLTPTLYGVPNDIFYIPNSVFTSGFDGSRPWSPRWSASAPTCSSARCGRVRAPRSSRPMPSSPRSARKPQCRSRLRSSAPKLKFLDARRRSGACIARPTREGYRVVTRPRRTPRGACLGGVRRQETSASGTRPRISTPRGVAEQDVGRSLEGAGLAQVQVDCGGRRPGCRSRRRWGSPSGAARPRVPAPAGCSTGCGCRRRGCLRYLPCGPLPTQSATSVRRDHSGLTVPWVVFGDPEAVADNHLGPLVVDAADLSVHLAEGPVVRIGRGRVDAGPVAAEAFERAAAEQDDVLHCNALEVVGSNA